MKKKETSAVLLLIGIVGFALFISNGAQGEATNGLNGEAGIVKADGTIIPLAVKGSALAIFTVNNVEDLTDEDYIYWRFWLNLKATGIAGILTSVRFKLWQRIDGSPSAWKAGTEGTSSATIPGTSPSEAWFQTNLPVEKSVTLPLKYRDALLAEGADEPPMAPYSVLSEDGTHAIRAVRTDRLGLFLGGAPDGYTVTLEMFCEVVEVTWEWTEAGVLKTGTMQPSPKQISYAFVITKTEAGLEATLTDEASQ